MMKKPLPRKTKLTLKKLVRECHSAGVQVSISLEDNQMPMQFPDDHEHIKLLVAESKRCSSLGGRWTQAKVPNPMAAEQCFRMGWAYCLAAAWLRAKLKGELLPEKKD